MKIDIFKKFKWIFVEISLKNNWNFNQFKVKMKYLLKLNLLFVEISINIHWKFGIGSKKKDEKVNEILLKNNLIDHSLKDQWLSVEIFLLTFKWYRTFTPKRQFYIT